MKDRLEVTKQLAQLHKSGGGGRTGKLYGLKVVHRRAHFLKGAALQDARQDGAINGSLLESVAVALGARNRSWRRFRQFLIEGLSVLLCDCLLDECRL